MFFLQIVWFRLHKSFAFDQRADSDELIPQTKKRRLKKKSNVLQLETPGNIFFSIYFALSQLKCVRK